MLNLGAGPGETVQIKRFRGEVAKLYGADIDPAVLHNPDVDEAVATCADQPLPFDTNFFDLVFSDYVLEHVEFPRLFLREIYRVLKPGGSFFFRTPNTFHYVGLLTRLTPFWLHRIVAPRAFGTSDGTPQRYPTFHRLNTRKRIRTEAENAGFSKTELRMCEAEPSYMVFSTPSFLAGVAYERAVNRFRALEELKANIFGRLVK